MPTHSFCTSTNKPEVFRATNGSDCGSKSVAPRCRCRRILLKDAHGAGPGNIAISSTWRWVPHASWLILIALSSELGFLTGPTTTMADESDAVIRQLKQLVTAAAALAARDRNPTA